MSERYILALDLGTTGNRVFCFNEKGSVLSHAYRQLTQHFPADGWVEHDPLEIWNAISDLIPEVLKKASAESSDIVAIGITNQRETIVLWDRDTGTPIYNAIVWQCRRTSKLCESLKKQGHEAIFKNKTGLFLDPYFSGTKISWLLDNVPGARKKAQNGKLCAGTVDSWVLWNLTGGKVHATDYTNASRTLLFDIKKLTWDRELCEILRVPTSILPSVQPSSSIFGKTFSVPGLNDHTIIGGIAGDQQAAMAGQNCVFEGTIKNTYGTGCFVLLNTGQNFPVSEKGLLTTIVCDNHGNVSYALEGSVFIAGAVVQWLRDYMKFFNDASEIKKIIEDIEHTEDQVVMVPAFVGLGAPHWDPGARGAIFGLTRNTTPASIIRAAIKSIALQSLDVIRLMEQESGESFESLRVDGGVTANKYLMQYQADILNKPVLLPENTETTALGAAYLAGISTGIYKTIDEIAQNNIIKMKFMPNLSDELRINEINLWNKALNKLITR